MNITKQFKLIIQLLVIINVSFAFDRITNLDDVHELYRATYSYRYRNNISDEFCNADFELKTAVCDFIFKNIILHIRIYLNKSAILHKWIDCEYNDIIVANNIYKQRMFPCYGRHDPVQSGWGVDDYYKFIYVSGGPRPNSIFIYHLERSPNADSYVLKELIKKFYINELQPLQVTAEDTSPESDSQNIVTINDDIARIEVNFIRKLIKNSFIPNFSICDLQIEQKYTLCELVIEKLNDVMDFNYQLLEKSKFRSLSATCERQFIQFYYHGSEETRNANREMFPCYGFIPSLRQSLTRLQLSDGYQEKTVLVHMFSIQKDNFNYYSFQSIIHNIRSFPLSSS